MADPKLSPEQQQRQRELQEYAWGAQQIGGITISRVQDGAMTDLGVWTPCVRLVVCGMTEENEPVTFVTYLSRREAAEMAQAIVETVCDG